MICPKCNSENTANTNFCAACGAELNQVLMPDTQTAPVQKNLNLKLILGTVGGLLAVIIIISLCVFLPGRGAEATLEKFFTAEFDCDYETYYECIANPYVANVYYDSDGIKTEYIEEFFDEYDDVVEECGYDVSVKDFKVFKTVEYSDSEIEAIVAYAAERYALSIDVLDDVCVLKTHMVIGGYADTETATKDFVMAKINGKWYVGIYGPEGSITSEYQLNKILEGKK